jgi:hypothetical protein
LALGCTDIIRCQLMQASLHQFEGGLIGVRVLQRFELVLELHEHVQQLVVQLAELLMRNSRDCRSDRNFWDHRVGLRDSTLGLLGLFARVTRENPTTKKKMELSPTTSKT